jgi:hypothetical protein
MKKTYRRANTRTPRPRKPEERKAGALLSADVDTQELCDELRDSLSGALEYRGQQMRDFDTTFALWPGQSEDGRAWDETRKGAGLTEAFPWNGASDSRNFLTDGLIAEQTRIMLAAVRRSRVQTTAVRTGTSASAQTASTLLTWMFYTHLEAMMMQQLALVARWRQQYGSAIMGVWWQEEPRLSEVPLRLDEMIANAMAEAEKGNPAFLETTEILLDPMRDEQAIQILRGMSPIVTERGARRALNELREKREAILPGIEVVSSLPCWRALRPFVDVFYPARTESVAEARWIARRQWLTEAQLRGAAAANGWDQDWVEEVLENGRGQSFDSESRSETVRLIGSSVARAPWEDPEELEHLVEVIWFYQLGVHEDYLLPTLYLTVFCPACATDATKDEKSLVAYHGPAKDEHARYPFVEFVRERVDHAFSEARSVAQIAKSWQAELKTERDNTVNRASVTTLPPLVVANTLGLTRLELGPGVQHSERKQGDIRWLNMPSQASDSAAVVERVEREADRYFARISEKVPEAAWQLMLEDLAGAFVLEVTQCMRLSLSLAQQYLPPTLAQRVAGDAQSTFTVGKEDIRGQYDVRLVFNANDINFATAVAKLEAYKNLVLAADRTGAVNTQKFLEMAARMLDPDMADQLVQTPEVAQETQVRAVKSAFVAILAGVEPDMAPVGSGVNYALQLQVLADLLQNPESKKRIQGQPDSRMLLERYVEHLQFGQMQTQNASTGRTGLKPLDWNKDMAAA